MMYLMPTPPATKTTLLMLCSPMPGGGQTKLPPTLTNRSDPRISVTGRQSHAAGGFRGDFWMASSKYPFFGVWSIDGSASLGVDVTVKPPA